MPKQVDRHHREHKRKEKPTLKASDLTKNEGIFRRMRKRNYAAQYEKCLDLIQTVNDHCHHQYTIYTVPVIVPGQAHYDLDECTIYLKEELLKADFYVRLMKPGNQLYISWKPEDVEKVRKMKERKRKEEEIDGERRKPTLSRDIIDYNPDSALSNVHLTTSLMMENPKYAHLKSLQKLRDRWGEG